MSCSKVLSDKVADIYHDSFKTDFIARLRGKGVSEEIVKKYEQDLSDDLVTSQAVKLGLKKDKIEEHIQEEVDNYYDIKKDLNKVVEEDYNPQNAKSGFEIPEPKVKTKVKVKDLEPLVYRPFKKSWVKVITDKVANMVIVNFKKFSVSYLHYKSKSHVKIDKEGNVTMYIKGDLKQVVEGNHVLVVKGDRAVKILGDDFHTVGKSYEVKVSKDKVEDIGAKYGIKTGGAFELQASGNATFLNDFKVVGAQEIATTLKVGATIEDMLGSVTLHVHLAQAPYTPVLPRP